VIRGRSPHYGKFTRTFPEDEDGDALFQVAQQGSDLSRPMVIDFVVAVPDEKAGLGVAKRARAVGYTTEVATDDEGEWIRYCSKEMIASYEAVVVAQEELRELAGPFGGEPDGWETVGNAAGDLEYEPVILPRQLGGRGGW
jgi:hypothetical protein